MTPEEAYRLVEIMVFAKQGSVTELNEMGQSALGEMVNILGGAYLTSLSDFCLYTLI